MRAQIKKTSLPSIIAFTGIVVGGSPLITDSLYRNFFMGGGLLLLFASWIVANLLKTSELKEQGRWENQKKAMIGMSLCAALGITMLTYYEMQMPKYNVALISKELYRVPPQLSKKQLRQLGAECNTYGNTLCSQAVFAKIVKLDPRDYYSLANLAMAQSHLGFHEHAITNFETAIKNGAKTYDIYKFYGHSLLALNQKGKALKAYNTSLIKNSYQESLKKKIQKIEQ